MSALVDVAEPGPAPLPPELPSGRLMGHLQTMQDTPVDLFVKAREFGDIVRVRFGPTKVNFVYDPAAVEHVMVRNAANYVKHTRGYEKLRLILGNGLVTSEGDFWKRQRRIANPAFHRKRIANFAGVMNQATLDTAAEWREGDGRIDLVSEMSRMTLRIAGETLFSQDISGESDAIGGSLSTVLKHFDWLTGAPLPYAEYWPLPSNWTFWGAMKDMHEVVDRIIADRRADNSEHLDLLGMFMDARDEDGNGMSDIQLRDEVLTMLLAGHETTAMALTWTLYLLAQHPEIGRRLEAEVDEALGDGEVGMEQMRSMPLLSRIIKESLRLYPPVWIQGRSALEDDVIGGYRIRKGSWVYTSAYAIHRHPDLWENPDAFDPDRWLPERDSKLPKGAYFPFAMGQRKCIGDRFAEMEATIALALLVRRFRFAVKAGYELETEAFLTLRPKGGMPMVLTPR